jgi:very-short-patch-repair endonuclease
MARDLARQTEWASSMRERESKSQPRAKQLRGKMPDAEVILWSRLRRSAFGGLKFRRQHPIGPYIADFACPLEWLVVELDGASHMTDDAIEYDRARDTYIRARGWNVLRFTNEDVYKNLTGVLDVIWRSRPTPSGARGRAPSTSPVNGGGKD